LAFRNIVLNLISSTTLVLGKRVCVCVGWGGEGTGNIWEGLALKFNQCVCIHPALSTEALSRTIHTTTHSLCWWITKSNILCSPPNDISTNFYRNILHFCIFKFLVLMIVITPMDWFW